MFNNDLNFTPFNQMKSILGNPFMLPPLTSRNETTNEQYPDETKKDTLYSYNKPIKKVPSNMGSRILNSLRELDLDLDESTDLARNINENIDTIYNKIELNYPGTFILLNSYNIPSPISKLIIRKIIKLSIKYCNKEDE